VPVEKVTVPDIGGAEGAEVIELLVAAGDEVTVDQGLIVLESDKASMEIPSTVSGTVVELLVKEGDQLSEGSVVAQIDVADAGASPDSEPVVEEAQSAVQEPAQAEAEAPVSTVEVTPPPDAPAPAAPPPVADVASETSPVSDKIYAGPAVRKLARELGVELDRVSGSGPQGRILKEDLQQFVRGSLSATTGEAAGGAGIPGVPEVDFGKFGEVEVSERSKLDKLTAANMHRSWLNVPHVTQFDEADITDLEEFRAGLKAEAAQRDVKLTPVPFLLKACAVALRDNPRLNSSLARGGEALVYKKYVHIGMAVDTPAGLVVPVVRDVDRKTIWELSAEVAELAVRARDRRLTPADMQGGCFTLSSLGAIGGSGFTPIVNTPEVGILGVSKAITKPVWNGADVEPRKMLPLALSYDHRVVNGGDGGRFLTRVVTLLSDIRQLSL